MCRIYSVRTGIKKLSTRENLIRPLLGDWVNNGMESSRDALKVVEQVEGDPDRRVQ